VLLVGDIDRGGVFAQLLGTLMLLEENEKERVCGLIINKFRGDASLLDSGIEMLEEKGGVPVVGTVPYIDIKVEDEDSLSDRLSAGRRGLIDIAVVRLPKISNFTDFDVFEQFPELTRIHGNEAADSLHLSGDLVALGEGGRLVHAGLPALHGVDEVALHPVHLGVIELGEKRIQGSCPDDGPFHAAEQLHALLAGVGTLVELARQGLNSQQSVSALEGGQLLVVEVVHHRLREDGSLGLGIDLRVDLVHVVAVEDAQARQGQAQLLPQLSEQMAGLHVEAGAFLCVASVNLVHSLLLFSIASPFGGTVLGAGFLYPSCRRGKRVLRTVKMSRL
jgi:hypothetical protein